MNILIATGHPAQIHNFKLLKNELEKRGHSVYWMATEKDLSKYLLDVFNIKYIKLKKPGKSIIFRVFVLVQNSIKCIRFIYKNNINIIVSRVSPYLSLAGFILNKPHIGFADTESSGLYDKIFTKFLTAFITSNSFKRTLRNNQIRIQANIELFYLHPNRFNPLSKNDVDLLLGLQNNEPYIIMRFVSWDAYHDKGLSGFTDKNKIKAVGEFSKYIKVFISAEKQLPEVLEPFRIKIPPEKMHDVLAHASLFFGESATMASESAVLGTPAIYLDKNGRGYTDEEEEFGLVFNFKNDETSQQKAIMKGVEVLKTQNLKADTHNKKERFISEKIDVTEFLVWFIEKWPNSLKIMKENPDYQYNFK